VRILHVANGRLFGGIERMLVTLAASAGASASPLRFEFAICSRGRLADELRDAGGFVHVLGDVRLSRPVSVWNARSRLRDLMAALGCEAVVCHAPWTLALFAPVARRAGVPVVFWQHDAATGRTFVERWAAVSPPDLAIANSRWTARTTPVLHPSASVVVIPCAVAPPPPLTSERRAALRQALGATPEECVLLMASRMEAWKGHVRLLRAAATLGDGFRWRIWIAGGPQREREAAHARMLGRLARDLGIAPRVAFLGERRDMPALLQAADVLCQPNTRPEPFGIVFAEALLAAIPVITSAMGGAVEIVDDTCGRLVPPGDDAALVTALRDLCGSAALRTRLGSAGPAHASRRCAPGVILPLIEAAVSACLSRVAA